MDLDPMPSQAAWTHRVARTGFEVVLVDEASDGHRLRGHTTAREDDAIWSVGYDIVVDQRWQTVGADVCNLAAGGDGRRRLDRAGDGRWTVDHEPRPDLDGCVDIDLESSAVTNTLPIHRLDLRSGSTFDVPAAFVRVEDLRVERLEQSYTLTSVGTAGLVVHYESATFAFACDLTVDRSGLVLDYPGLARRSDADATTRS